MPTLTIDHRSIAVPGGTKVITAAERLGIMIPRFCFHPALGAVGACRVCAVKFVEGPVKGIEMSCMVDAADGMVVATDDPEAVDFRRHVIEFLMLNHPHDCPVCDEGGHCLLQDLTVSGNHGIRRYRGDKRTHRNQYLGPFVAHEMNRCIQCYRCVRLYREYLGGKDLGVMGIGSRVYFGRQKEGPLASPFAGNLIDICPTGVFTDRPSRHKGRHWDFERTPGICTHCALGCNITISARYREVVRREARLNEEINGYFICDRGRYGYAYGNAEERPRQGIIRGQAADNEETVARMAAELAAVVNNHGPEAVAVVGTCRSSLETLGAMTALCRQQGYFGPVLYESQPTADNLKRAAARFSMERIVNVKQLSQADFILCVGADPLNEAPMLAPTLRKAVKNGARLAVMDPRPIELPCEFDPIRAAPHDLAVRLAGLLQASIRQELIDRLPPAAALFDAMEGVDIDPGRIDAEQDAAVVQALKESPRPVILCGTQICDAATIDLAAHGVYLLTAAGKNAGLFYLFPQANSLAAGRWFPEAGDLDTLVDAMETGRIKALITVECDPWSEGCRRGPLEKALEALDLIAGMDAVQSPWVSKCHLFLPTATVDEGGGLFINAHGTAQMAPKALAGGIPIAQTGRGSHPPRTFSPTIPGGDLLRPETALWQLAGMPAEDMTAWIEGGGGFARLLTTAATAARAKEHLSTAGLRPPSPQIEPPMPPLPRPPDKDGLILLLVEEIFGTERLSSLSPAVRERTAPPVLTIHPEDARRFKVMNRRKVRLTTDTGELVVPLKISPDVTPGVAVLPRHTSIEWQVLGGMRLYLGPGQLTAHIKE